MNIRKNIGGIAMKNYVITISRGYGSGGKTIGKTLAEELGYEFYDLEVLKLASEKSGINEKLFAQNDENIKGLPFYKTMGQKPAFKGEVIPPSDKNFVSDENLFNYQAVVIRELAKEKNCVFVGRAADFILSDYDNVLKVNVQAPHSFCVKTVAERDMIDEDAAEKKYKKIDKERAAYYKYYTGNEWDDARNYDITLNGSIGWDKCIELIKAALKIKFED